MFNIQKLLSEPVSSSVFHIAELGINHDGDVSKAKNMIDRAVEAKADAVKFQIYNIDGFYNQSKAPEAYQLFQGFSISLEDFMDLRSYAEKKGILCFAAPFDEETLKYFIKEKVFPIKIASGDALTEPWINILLEHDVPFLISCGSLEAEEVNMLIRKIKNTRSALLYCVSEYPAPPEGFDIRYIDTLQFLLPNQAVGFSDHSQGTALSLAAVARGAKIIERHFTIEPERTDYDHPLSLSPEQFFEMVQSSRIIEKALGTGNRVTTAVEKKIKSLASRDIFAARDIPQNHKITKDDIILQRPGAGVTIKDYHRILGQSVSHMIPKGTRIRDIIGE